MNCPIKYKTASQKAIGGLKIALQSLTMILDKNVWQTVEKSRKIG